MTITLRPFAGELLDGCAAVYVATFSAPPWNEPWPLDSARIRLQELIETPRSQGLVAIRDEVEVLGFILGNLLQGTDHAVAKIAELCVHPDVQRLGVGSRLVDGFERIVRDAGAASLVLTTGPEAVAFYERLGYQRRDDWISMTHDLPGSDPPG